MQLYLDCPRHGRMKYEGNRGFVVGNATVSFQGCRMRCPVQGCPELASIVDGTYTVIDSVVRAFRAPGVTQQKIFRFRDIVKDVQAGTVDTSSATEEIASLGSALAALWKWTNDNGAALAVVIAIITLYLQITAGQGADESAEKIQKATEQQTQVQQMIYQELQQRAVDAPEAAAPVQPRERPSRAAPPQTQGQASPGNRKSRRAAAAKRRRGP